MTEAAAEPPRTRAGWRAWIRDTRPGDVRRLAMVTQGELAARIGVHQVTLSTWENGSGLPGDWRGIAWYEAVTEMAAGAAALEVPEQPVDPVLAAHRAGTLVLG